MIKFKTIKNEEIDWANIEKCYDHTIYKSKEWVEFLIEYQKVTPFVLEIYEDEKLCGYFIGEKFKRFFTIIASPFEGWSTSYQGISMLEPISPKKRVAIYEGLISYVFENRLCSFIQISDWMLDITDVAHTNLNYQLIKGYYLDLTKSEEELLNNMTNVHSSLKKAIKKGVTIKPTTDYAKFVPIFFDQLFEVFRKQGLTPTHNEKYISLLFNKIASRNCILALQAYNNEKECIASNVTFYDGDKAFCFSAGSYSRFQNLYPNESLWCERIFELKRRGVLTLEFGGGRSYKEKYGPKVYVKPQIYAARYSYIIYLKAIAKFGYYFVRKIKSKIVKK